MPDDQDRRGGHGSREEEAGRAGGQLSSVARGGPWASVLLTINDRLDGIASRLDEVERRQQQDEAGTPREGAL